MRRFLIGSAKFEGSIEIKYDSDNYLHTVSFAGTTMPAEYKAAFLKIISGAVSVDFLQSAFSRTKVIISEAEFEVTFEMFWHEYPYKRNRHIAEEVFNKLLKPDQIRAWEAATEYAKYCKRNEWYNKKLADLWLKTKQFLNDWKTL